ncbi:MAG: hypothetical protein D6805_09675, partial [Planctomycetota bacterium]
SRTPTTPTLPSHHPTTPISRLEAENLFSSQELAQLKLQLLTSSNPKLRLEALRKIYYSPLPPEQKYQLFLQTLGDDNVEIRQETLRLAASLQNSIPSPLLKKLAQLLDQSPSQARNALRELLQHPLPKTQYLHVFLATACIKCLELFGHELDIKTMALALLENLAPNLPLNKQDTLQFIETFLSYHEEKNFSLMERIQKTTLAFAKQYPETTLFYLEKRIEENPPLRTLLLWIYFQLHPKKFSQKYKKLILQKELLDYLQGTTSVFLFEKFLDQEFRTSIPTLLQSLQARKLSFRLRDLKLLEGIFLRVNPPKQYWHDLAKEIITALRFSPLPVTNWALESKIMLSPNIPFPLREKFVQEILYHLRQTQFQQYRQNLFQLLAKFSMAAVRPLLRFIEDPAVDNIVRKEAIHELVHILLQAPQKSLPVQKAFHHIFQRFSKLYLQTQQECQGALAQALGKICYSPLATFSQVEQTYQLLLKSIPHSPFALEAMEGLSYLANSPSLSQSHQEKLVKLFLNLLGQSLKERPGIVRLQPTGVVFEEDLRSKIHTSLIPPILDGIAYLFCRPKLHQHLQKLILKTLLIKWKKVSSFEEIWSPFNIERLLHTMQKIGSYPHTPFQIKNAILQELLHFLQHQEDVIVSNAISNILFHHPTTSDFSPYAQQFCQLLLKISKNIHLQEIEVSLNNVYLCLAQILAKGFFSHSHPLFHSAYQFLVSALRENREGSREALHFLKEHTNSPELKSEITSYLL